MMISKRVRLILLPLVVLVAVVALFSPYWFPKAGRLFLREDPIQPDRKPSALLILMGDSNADRARKAVEVAKVIPNAPIFIIQEAAGGFTREGIAPPNDWLHRMYLIKHGVDPNRLVNITDCATGSTLDESVCIRTYFLKKNWIPSSIGVITSWYHTSRAGWIFDRSLASHQIKVHMIPAFTPECPSPEFWYRDEASFFGIIFEAIKYVYWSLKGF